MLTVLVPFAACGGSRTAAAQKTGAAGQQGTGSAGSGGVGAGGTAGDGLNVADAGGTAGDGVNGAGTGGTAGDCPAPVGSSGAAGAGGAAAGAGGTGGSGGSSGTGGGAGDSAFTGTGGIGDAGLAMSDAADDAGGDGVVRVNPINADNWNETTIYPFAKRRMLVRDEGDPHVVMIDLGKTPALQWRTPAGGAYARGMQLIGHNQILGGRNDGYEVFDYTTGAIVKTVHGFCPTQSAYRMVNGETMLTQSGTVLTFLGKDDQPAHQISYPGYSYVRLARPTRNNTFLIPSDTTVFEGDATGKVLWTLTNGAPGWGHIWEPLLMSDGNVLLATAFGSSLDVIDRTTHMVTRRYGTKMMANAAMFRPNFYAEFEILPNGNLITSNWQGHNPPGAGIQIIEFSPAGDVVWYYKQDPAIFSSIQGVMVLDGKDPQYLHVEETSTDSTWQPLVPTP